MKWLIASDIHGSAHYCRRLIDRFIDEKADRLLLLGDILYHGPRNDLPDGYAPKEVADMLNGIKNSILCVRGNCDAEVDQLMLEFPIMSDYAAVDTGDRLIYATHGHIYNRSKLLPLKSGDILLHGHTHVPVCENVDGITVMNPGSVSIPKDGSYHGCMIMENGRFLWKDLEGNVQNEYL